MSIKDVASNYNDYQVKMRRYFHENPEVSAKEYNTSKVIKEELDKIGVPWVACGLETGVLATIKGAKPGKTILLRGDIDALSVQETTGLEYASKNEGVMHACGHDCHISMLLTAAHILNDMKDELLDRFGEIPKSVDNLLRIALIRVSAHGLFITEIKGKNERITFTFRPDAEINPAGIPDLLKKYGKDLAFTAYGNPFFTYKYKKTGLAETDAELLLDRTEKLLEEMSALLAAK